ncbi:MAG: general secretion pathway protein GspK [Deltaproteobacteria bacterium]|nr:general secretion pathway protein GspK [Deltaproteobacteria bacterium]
MRNERGIILLVVVWALTVLMVISVELARTMRIEGLTADTYQQEVKTYYLALAGFHRALYQVLRAQQQGRTMLDAPGGGGGLRRGFERERENGLEEQQDIWARGDGRWQSEEFGTGGYWVRVVDEGGKINLNQVDEPTLRQTFANISFDVKFSEELTDAILDWRDTDSLVRLHGAESDYYLALKVPYPAKDGLFDTLDELLLVRGVTPALFYGRDGPALRDLFTVYSAGGGATATNLLTASPLVLQAVLGIDAAMAQDLVQRRAETTAVDLANLIPGGTAGRSANFGLPSVVTIDSIGYLNTGGVTRRLSAVVQRMGVNGFRFLRWQDRPEASGAPAPRAG